MTNTLILLVIIYFSSVYACYKAVQAAHRPGGYFDGQDPSAMDVGFTLMPLGNIIWATLHAASGFSRFSARKFFNIGG